MLGRWNSHNDAATAAMQQPHQQQVRTTCCVRAETFVYKYIDRQGCRRIAEASSLQCMGQARIGTKQFNHLFIYFIIYVPLHPLECRMLILLLLNDK